MTENDLWSEHRLCVATVALPSGDERQAILRGREETEEFLALCQFHGWTVRELNMLRAGAPRDLELWLLEEIEYISKYLDLNSETPK